MDEKLTNMIQELGLGDLPAENRDVLLAELGEVIFTAAMRRSWNVLNLEEQEELVGLFEASAKDAKDEEKQVAVRQFIESHVPDFNTYIQEELETFLKTYKETYTQIG